MDKTSLGDRMKANYEQRARTYLTRRTPVILRLDGKAFHTFTRGAVKPFDNSVISAMQHTMEYLVENIQGARFGYTQSDEISILVCDYDRHETGAWFDYQVQKVCSVAASMATAMFNSAFHGKFTHAFAMFDCRAFNIPQDEVANYFLWRYQDWARNSTSMVAQSMFSHKELQGMSVKEMEVMIADMGWRWEQYEAAWRHGTCYGMAKYFSDPMKAGKRFYPDMREDRDWIDQVTVWTAQIAGEE